VRWLTNLFRSDTKKPADTAPAHPGQGGDAKAIADYCRLKLDLANAHLSDEYRYRSLPLCVINAVFSINARYAS
jgi:hypothetical protein